MNGRVRVPLLAATALAGLLIAPWTGTAAEPSEGRIVAIGDIHGALDAFLSVLRASELVDEEGKWIGGRATLVQMGDFTDRGTRVREVMDLLRRLEREAEAAGGRVIVMLGNHESMNLTGHLRDVTPEIYAAFATPADAKLRASAWRKRKALARRQARWTEEPFIEPGEEVRREWSEARPPGYFEYVEALGPDGEYGRWIRSLPTVVRIGETIFVHGGLSPELTTMDLDEINEAVTGELEAFDGIKRRLVDLGVALPHFDMNELTAVVSSVIETFENEPQRLGSPARRTLLAAAVNDFVRMRDWLNYRSDGPLWFRGYAHWSEEEGETEVAEILAAYGADRIVVGHTPPRPPSDVQPRFAGRVFLIDTGMLEGHYPGGRPSALELTGDRITAIYEDKRVVLVDEPVEAVASTVSTSHVASTSRQADADPATPRPEVASSPTEGEGPWLGPDGSVLPFSSGDEVQEYLETAKVLSWTNISVGITRPKKLLLENDGVRAHAVFRYEHSTDRALRLSDGTFHMFFRDSYRGEPAAFELARLLRLDTVPPATNRTIRRLGSGSVQLWIENAMREHDRRTREIELPDRAHFFRQMYNMFVFDNLVHNIDRNLGNILIGPDWKLWYIDCTRCFAASRDLFKPDRVRKIERRFWKALQALDWDEVRERLRPYLSRFEIRALRIRHGKLVELLRKRIDELGEEAVLFSFDQAPGPEPLEMPDLPPPTQVGPEPPPDGETNRRVGALAGDTAQGAPW